MPVGWLLSILGGAVAWAVRVAIFGGEHEPTLAFWCCVLVFVVRQVIGIRNVYRGEEEGQSLRPPLTIQSRHKLRYKK